MTSRGGTAPSKNDFDTFLHPLPQSPPQQAKMFHPSPLQKFFEVFRVPPCWREDEARMVGDGGVSVAYSGINVNIILLRNKTKKVCDKLQQTKRNPYFQAVSSDWFDFS